MYLGIRLSAVLQEILTTRMSDRQCSPRNWSTQLSRYLVFGRRTCTVLVQHHLHQLVPIVDRELMSEGARA